MTKTVHKNLSGAGGGPGVGGWGYRDGSEFKVGGRFCVNKYLVAYLQLLTQ